MSSISSVKWSLIFVLFILILKDGYDSAKMEKLKTEVPKACRELPDLSKRCMEKNSQGSKRCKKLPTITRKCQELSVSWQLLAETFQKVTKPKTIAKNENVRKNMKKGKLTSHSPKLVLRVLFLNMKENVLNLLEKRNTLVDFCYSNHCERWK